MLADVAVDDCNAAQGISQPGRTIGEAIWQDGTKNGSVADAELLVINIPVLRTRKIDRKPG